MIRKDGIANHKYLPDYDSSKNSTDLQYLDANNLYGYAMNKNKWAVQQFLLMSL